MVASLERGRIDFVVADFWSVSSSAQSAPLQKSSPSEKRFRASQPGLILN